MNKNNNYNYKYTLSFKIKKYLVLCCGLFESAHVLFGIYLTKKYILFCWLGLIILCLIPLFNAKFPNGRNDRIVLYVCSYAASIILLIDNISNEIILYILLFELFSMIVLLTMIIIKHMNGKTRDG